MGREASKQARKIQLNFRKDFELFLFFLVLRVWMFFSLLSLAQYLNGMLFLEASLVVQKQLTIFFSAKDSPSDSVFLMIALSKSEYFVNLCIGLTSKSINRSRSQSFRVSHQTKYALNNSFSLCFSLTYCRQLLWSRQYFM